MRKVLVLLLLTSVIALLSCAPTESPGPEGGVAQAPVSNPASGPAKTGWELEWEKALEGAKKEGPLTAYVYSGPEVRAVIGKAVKDKFGLEINWVAGSGRELATRTFNERKAGLYIPDFSISGTSTALNILKPAGVLELVEPHLILPEVVDPKAWYIGKLPFFDRDKMVFSFRAGPTSTITINTQMARKEDISSYRDLLNPRWKGKIAWLDPTIGGSGNQVFSVVGGIIMGYDFMKELARQEPMFTRDRRLLAEWVARGKYYIGLGVETGMVLEFRRLGAPVDDFSPKEGSYMTSGSGNIFIYNQAPHPNSRKVFINWLLSKEGQLLLSKTEGYQSARADIPTDNLSPERIRQPGIKYFMADTEEWEAEKEKRFALAGEIFGHLMRQ